MPLEEPSQNEQTLESIKRMDDNDVESPLMRRDSVEELVLRKSMLSLPKYNEHKELCNIFRRLKRRLEESESDKMAGKCRSQICVWRGR